ncbi:hypothetical protein NDU88_004704 [Pleurodeles waltl]|uniref:Uncharacterized protein n=1 Tax=Pleurodeles waltl TaxID=8319 RepID=A0AAV7W9R7_PLEWA|nr:hypothetical protein NDU88_004704 [Pleurodeles waltl]
MQLQPRLTCVPPLGRALLPRRPTHSRCRRLSARRERATPVAPRVQETVPSCRVWVHNDRPIRDLHLRPQAGHINKEKLEARTEPRFTHPPSWPG